jgi:ABC-type nitrate/sulfonate/bicarbonate transport system permease component
MSARDIIGVDTPAAEVLRESEPAPGGRSHGPLSFLTSDRAARWTSRLVLVLIWVLASRISDHVASPLETVRFLVDEYHRTYRGEVWTPFDNELARNLAFSLERTAVALVIIVLIGIPVGYAMGRWWRVQALFTDTVTVGIALPAYIWALLAVMWFGFGNRAPIFCAVVSATPGLIVYTLQGTLAVPRDLRDMSDAYGVSFGRQARSLVLPSMAGALIAGFRLAIIAAWGCVVLVEWFGSDTGAGYRARYFYDNANYTGLMGWALIVLVIVITIDRGIIERVDRRVHRWRGEVGGFSATGAKGA